MAGISVETVARLLDPTLDDVEVLGLACILRAAETEPDARAWLRGEGRMQRVGQEYRFVRYADERAGPRSTAWRTAVYERDGYKCRDCGAKGDLNAHHVQPWALSLPSRFDVENGLTLCRECHAQRHPKQANLIRKARYHHHGSSD